MTRSIVFGVVVTRGGLPARIIIMHSIFYPTQVIRNQYEDMWEKIMKSHKWVHFLPQVKDARAADCAGL